MGLNREMLGRRLRDVDFRIVAAMQCATMRATAHRSSADARNDTNPITRPADADGAAFYRVTYPIKTLLDAGVYSDPQRQPVIVLVDLNKHGNYPFTAPESHVIGAVTPWSPHFLPQVPVCFEVPGHVWRADGSTTLGHLLQHLARLINFDEKIIDPGYVGYNGPAIKFWRKTLKAAPITPKLTYPMLPDWYFDPTGATAPAPAAPAPRAPRAAVVRTGLPATTSQGPAVVPRPRVRMVPPAKRHDG